MISWHKEGQPVVCIRNVHPSVALFFKHHPMLGSEYTISKVQYVAAGDWSTADNDKGGISFRLAELPSDAAYASLFFQPLYPQEVENLRRLATEPPQNSDPGHAPPADQRVRETTE